MFVLTLVLIALLAAIAISALLIYKSTELWFPYEYTNRKMYGDYYACVSYVNLRNSKIKTTKFHGSLNDEMFLFMRTTFLLKHKINLEDYPHLKEYLTKEKS